MKIKEAVIERLRKMDSNRIHALLMLALNCSQSTVRVYINNNTDDLTKAAALKVIREETGLSDEDILEADDSETAKVQNRKQ